MSETVIYTAREIVTMNPGLPVATHVAVRNGHILAVGNAESVSGWGEHRTDSRFADKVITPGFVEGHSHLMAGGIWEYLYVGYHKRVGPDGQIWEALESIDAVIVRLKSAAEQHPSGQPLVAWGFDPIFLPGERLNRQHLDAVSSEHPIVVMHSNFHLMTVNSPALKIAGYDRSTDIEGVHKDDSGNVSGELQEMHAMFPVMRRLNVDFNAISNTDNSVWAYASTANRCGVTTATDLYAELDTSDVNRFNDITKRDDYPLRLVPALSADFSDPDAFIKKLDSLVPLSTDKLRLGTVKLMTDGSIQGFTARVKWPGYFKGPDHGIWNMPPEQLKACAMAVNRAGYQMHIHTNGDEASEVTLDAIEAALNAHPRVDHRHTLQHCQMASPAQFKRMARLGMCCNLFANHIYYFGDQHHDITLGPDRARNMNACNTALSNNIPLAIHSDAPVTPMGPLTTAWCAANRLTESGRVLGEHERISAYDALNAVTLGAAFTLKLDNEIGSIEVGKRADFAILDDNPLTVNVEAVKDVGVWGTVLGGHVFPIDQ